MSTRAHREDERAAHRQRQPAHEAQVGGGDVTPGESVEVQVVEEVGPGHSGSACRVRRSLQGAARDANGPNVSRVPPEVFDRRPPKGRQSVSPTVTVRPPRATVRPTWSRTGPRRPCVLRHWSCWSPSTRCSRAADRPKCADEQRHEMAQAVRTMSKRSRRPRKTYWMSRARDTSLTTECAGQRLDAACHLEPQKGGFTVWGMPTAASAAPGGRRLPSAGLGGAYLVRAIGDGAVRRPGVGLLR